MVWGILLSLFNFALNQVFGMFIGLIVLSAIFSYEGLFEKLKHGVLITLFIFGLFYNFFIFAVFENYIIANLILFFLGVMISIITWRTRIYIISKSRKLADSIKKSI